MQLPGTGVAIRQGLGLLNPCMGVEFVRIAVRHKLDTTRTQATPAGAQ
jgi:hypothetical protein